MTDRPLLGMPALSSGADSRVLLAALDLSGRTELWLRLLGAASDDWQCSTPPVAPETFEPPVVLPRVDGAWDLFCRGRDARAWRVQWKDGGWSEWHVVTGEVVRLVGLSAPAGEPLLFAVRPDGSVGSIWAGECDASWQSLGGSVVRLQAAGAERRRLLAACGTDGAVWVRTVGEELRVWSPWVSLGGSVPEATRLAATVRVDGTAEVYVLGHDRAVWTRAESAPGGPWEPWESLGGSATEIACTCGPGERRDLYVRGADGALWSRTRETDGGSWSPWQSLGGRVGTLAAATKPDGGSMVVSASPDSVLSALHRDIPHGEWSPWTNLTPWVEPGSSRGELASRFAVEWTDPGLRGTSCGPGSTLEETRAIRAVLPAILRGFGIRVLNDAGCGDRTWICEVDLSGVDYLGYDLRAWPGGSELPFELRDVVHEPLRPCDLILCRDVLFHLPNPLVMRALRNFAASSRYLLTTSMDRYRHRDVWHPLDNLGRHTWSHPGESGYSPLNLEAAPFRFPPPLLAIPERSQQDRFVGLWDLHAIPGIAGSIPLQK